MTKIEKTINLMKEENTYRRYNEGDHKYDDFSEAIFEQDHSHKCPTYVHKTPPCQGSAHLVKTYVDGYKLLEELSSHLKICLCQNTHLEDLHLLTHFRHKWAEYVQHRVKVGATETKLMTMSELMLLSNL